MKGKLEGTRQNYHSLYTFPSCFGYKHDIRVSVHRQYNSKKLRGLSPRANYTDRAAAAGRRS